MVELQILKVDGEAQLKVASTKLTNPEWEKLQDKCNEQAMLIAGHPAFAILKRDARFKQILYN